MIQPAELDELLGRWWFNYEEGHFDVLRNLITDDAMFASSILVAQLVGGVPSPLPCGIANGAVRLVDGALKPSKFEVVLDTMVSIVFSSVRG